jgi:hypothetical protein
MSVLAHIPLLLTLAGATGATTAECPAVPLENRPWLRQVLRWIDDRTDEPATRPAKVTGIPASYDRTLDAAMDGQGAIYDLAITAILLSETCRLDAAIPILDRLELMWTGRGLPNLVATRLATTGTESVVHTGPNAWVGLAAHRVWLRGGHVRHLRFAQAIADWIVRYREHDDGEETAPPWLSLSAVGARGRAPAMGPREAFSPVGAVLDWPRIVSTEHALDVYALLNLLKDEPVVPADRQRSYGDALAEVRGYLQSAATNPACRNSAGVGLRGGDVPVVCIETGFEAKDKQGTSLDWSRKYNAADVYYWWVAAVPDGAIAGARTHGEILATARTRFHQVVRVGDQLISGTDYFTCTAAPEDQECKSARGDSAPESRDGGVPHDGPTGQDAGSPAPNALGTSVAPPSPVATSGGDERGMCSLLGVGVCAEIKNRTQDARGFWQFARSRPMVSVEWTGEAILANRLVGNEAYATELLGSMDRLQAATVVAGASSLAYPYATASCECVFDGAWLSPAPPKGGGPGTLAGSLAGTVWVAFGRLGINPFDPKRSLAKASPQSAGPPREGLTAPARLPAPPCPIPSEQDGGADVALLPDFEPAHASPEALVTAAWLCLDRAHGTGTDAERARQAIKAWVGEALGRRLVDADALRSQAKEAPIPWVSIEDLAGRRQDEAAFSGRGCAFKDFPLNDVATARLVQALATGDHSEACDEAATIVRRYPSGCFWHAREVPGEPHDRFREVTSSWTPIGSPPRLAGPGFHVAVINVLANQLPDCVARMQAAPGRDAAAVAEARRSRGLPWLLDGDTHALRADNLYFSERHRGIWVARGEGRLGVAPMWGPLMVVPYVYARGIDARGASPLDREVWLRNWGVGGGLEARLSPERPAWLRELEIRLGFRGGHIGYHTPAAPSQLTDWEVLGALSGRSLAYFPMGERHGLWTEMSAAAYGGQTTLWSVGQHSIWVSSAVQAGASFFHTVELYGSAVALANLLQDTDWDNNLRLGGGARLPLLAYADGPITRFVLRLDGFWEHTVAYWPSVEYVPSFRPLSDYRISVDAWFAWSGR